MRLRDDVSAAGAEELDQDHRGRARVEVGMGNEAWAMSPLSPKGHIRVDTEIHTEVSCRTPDVGARDLFMGR